MRGVGSPVHIDGAKWEKQVGHQYIIIALMKVQEYCKRSVNTPIATYSAKDVVHLFIRLILPVSVHRLVHIRTVPGDLSCTEGVYLRCQGRLSSLLPWWGTSIISRRIDKLVTAVLSLSTAEPEYLLSLSKERPAGR